MSHEVNNPVNFATNALRTLSAYVLDVETVAARAAGLAAEEEAPTERRVAEFAGLLEELDFEETVRSLQELLKIVADGLGRTQGLVTDLKDFEHETLKALYNHHLPFYEKLRHYRIRF